MTDLLAPWATLYADHRWLQTAVLFAHLAGMFLAGGFAIATDRDTFIAVRAARLSGQIRHLGRIHTIHRPIMVGLVLSIVSGFLLFGSDAEHFAGAATFWLKMALLTALLGNGYLLKRTEEALSTGRQESPQLWRRLTLISAASLVLWLALILCGVLLSTA